MGSGRGKLAGVKQPVRGGLAGARAVAASPGGPGRAPSSAHPGAAPSSQARTGADRERVRDASPIVDVIQDYFPLLPDGRGFKALCPFHSEKTPSFKVNPDTGTYHCFGCQERGDVFSLIQKLESLNFMEALEHLAERARIPLTRPGRAGSGGAGSGGAGSGKGVGAGGRPGQVAERRDRQREILRTAQHWFQEQLLSPAGAPARDYLVKRGFQVEILRRFGVGFAPRSWNALLGHLHARGVQVGEAASVGLVRMRPGNEGAYDTFRGRVLFPIRDLQGRTLGFGARLLDGAVSSKEVEEPKYLNSPESALFKKGQILYGLHEGRDPIRRQRRLLLMEGYTDVMMAHQAGFELAVATLGTALTDGNVEQICRHADHVTLLFDGDRAGRNAACKAVGVLLERPIGVGVVLLEQGQDPCDLLTRPDGVQQLHAALEAEREALRFVLDELVAEHTLEGPEQRERIARGLYVYAARLPSELRQREVLLDLAGRLGSREDVVLRDFARWQQAQRRVAPRPGQGANRVSTRPGSGLRRTDECALVLGALAFPERATLLLQLWPAEQFVDAHLQQVARAVQEHAQGKQLSRAELVACMDGLIVEDPAARSVWLELREALLIQEHDEERVRLMAQELLAQRLDHWARQERTELRSLAGELPETQDARLVGLQRVRMEIDRLKGVARTWDELRVAIGEWLGSGTGQGMSSPGAA